MHLKKTITLFTLGLLLGLAGCSSGSDLLPIMLSDANRDGAINETDAPTEGTSSLETLILANIDDDDSDGTPDAWDAIINTNPDSLDITRITLGQAPDLPEDAQVYLYVQNATAAKRVNIWQLSPEP